MAYFSWLHLSDLHMGMTDQKTLWPTVKHSFFEDLRKTHERTGPWHVVLFTGDLTQKAEATEFEQLSSMLDELWTQLKILGSSPLLFPIPGNHDLQRPNEEDPGLLLLKQWWNIPKVRDGLWKSEASIYRATVNASFANYTQWIGKAETQARLPSSFKTGLLPGDASAVFDTEFGKVGVAGLNSAWLQLDSANYDKSLAVDTRQLHSVTNADPIAWCKENTFNLLLTHHPISWLHATALKEWQSEINPSGLFDAHLFGHMHDHDATSFSRGGGGVVRSIQAASMFGLEKFGDQVTRSHGYAIGRIDGEAEEIRIWPRHAIRTSDGSWKLSPDHNQNLDNNESFSLLPSRKQLRKPPPSPAHKTQAAPLDPIARMAISPEHRDVELPTEFATPCSAYDATIKLRSGKMLERMLASTIVRREKDPVTVVECTIERNATIRELESAAPWLRFSLPGDDSRVYSIVETFCTKASLDEVHAIRLKAHLLGWAGCPYLPVVDWRDRWCCEKFSFYYARAYLRGMWKDQDEFHLRYLTRSFIEANEHHKKFYQRDIGFLDVLSGLKGVPASNSKIVLSEAVRSDASSEFKAALVSRLSVTPAVDAIPDLRKLVLEAEPELATSARIALAFIPGSSSTVRDLKRSLVDSTPAALSAAAGTDRRADASDALNSFLTSSDHRTKYTAAWALCRIANLCPVASQHIRTAASENEDSIVRSICLIGLAKESPREAESKIAGEYASARDLAKFCLSIALTYISDAREMLKLLASTGEDRLYVPFLHPCFQLLFDDAMKHAAVKSPILGEMLSLSDDI